MESWSGGCPRSTPVSPGPPADDATLFPPSYVPARPTCLGPDIHCSAPALLDPVKDDASSGRTSELGRRGQQSSLPRLL